MQLVDVDGVAAHQVRSYVSGDHLVPCNTANRLCPAFSTFGNAFAAVGSADLFALTFFIERYGPIAALAILINIFLDLLFLLACVCVIILLLFVFLESIVIVNLAFEILLWDFFGKGLRWFIAH